MSATTSTTTLAPTTTLRRPRALLLDDDALSVKLLRTALQCRGFEVRAEADGEAGLAALLDTLLGLDVLVVDLELPGRDGWSLLRLIRGAGGEEELPVVIVASEVTPQVRAQLRSLGADAIVDRRDGPAAVARAVDQCVGHPAARTRLRAVTDALAVLLVPVAAPVAA